MEVDKMLQLIAAGLISGILSPVLVSLLQHRVIWRNQKRLDIKFTIFTEAVRALSLWATDVIDPYIQAKKPAYKGVARIVEARPETWELLERSSSMIHSFFSKTASEKFDKARKAKISIENIPNLEFEEARTNAIITLSKELGIR